LTSREASREEFVAVYVIAAIERLHGFGDLTVNVLAIGTQT
jgi:hypothetical protein